MNSLKHKRWVYLFSLMFAWIFCVTTLSTASAMSHGKMRKKNPEQIVSEMKTRLSLTDDQAEKILPVIESQTEKGQALFEKARSQGREGRKAMRSEMQALARDTEEQLSAILTDDQMTEYKKMREEQRQKMRQRMKKNRE
ncbi:hypothetical protein DENIS_4283 [Desulfonema ishimotonii]|uniref:Periplasmic heavy metal sensor n=1 Tax=Desulfonema ishimotonii TaxID=45657 RepID=A0A401G234_9BACT|nr:hypothetical protein [Desulfonema ishimotonii]GBC63289.1 hypothetical protein DENIS_4283 [Desulfonema ishimotonii]